MVSKAAVDIGTNSMRLLIVNDEVEVGRWQQVTGLGRGALDDGRLRPDAIERTVAALETFGSRIRSQAVSQTRVVATAASRRAVNREEFFDRAEQALGVRPELISGEEEARLAFAGATAGLEGAEAALVVDIGGGSTEFVTAERAVSLELGSVRLTDRFFPQRPATFEHLEAAATYVEELLEGAALRSPLVGATFEWVIGVAGTWTSLSAINLELPVYDRDSVHHSILNRLDLDRLVERLASLTVAETAAIPSLDPKRAPVILGGAVAARGCLRSLGLNRVVISEHDLLDGVIASLGDDTDGRVP